MSGFLIKLKNIKLVRESICVAVIYSVIIFAIVNLGFSSPYKSQINKHIWVDALFKLNADSLKNTNEKGGLRPKVEQGKTNLASTGGLKELKIPFLTPPDSNSNKNAGLTDTLQADTSKSNSAVNQSVKTISPIHFYNFLDTSVVEPKSISLVAGVTPKDSLEFIDKISYRNSHWKPEGFIKDTVKIDYRALDSTARIENFKYHRVDEPVVTIKKERTPSFYVRPSGNISTRTAKIDSTGKYVEITETRGGQPSKILLRVPLDEYIDLMIKAHEKEDWEDLSHQYEYKDMKKDLGKLLSDITNFEIPLPSVGVLTIFGEPKISLKIGGAVDIHGAWRNETTEGVTASALGNSRNEPDFKQQVQINVNGTIGDKLNISADWNTERTFEYENQLKIKYTGYEDEIIQSIEGGNVSLQTSPLVGGSEALFGVKAQLKLGPLSLTMLASQKKGEVKEVAVTGGSTSQTFQIKAYGYSTNHYFIDSIYADTSSNLNLFNKYFGRTIAEENSNYYVSDIQVWKSIQTTIGNRAKERNANCYIDLPQLHSATDRYDSSYRGFITNPVPGQSETGRFVLLTEGVDYTIHRATGFISFMTQVNDQDIIAVAFRQNKDPNSSVFYGEILNPQLSDTSTLVLKLVKPKYLKPDFIKAWKLQLKNIYPVGGRNIKTEGFDFQIKRQSSGQPDATDINGVRFLTAFGLDLYDASANLTPDNIFDWRPDITIMPTTGEIIFPVLQPFGKNLPQNLPADYAFQDVYDTSLTFAQQVTSKDRWLLTGKYSGDVSSVYQLGFNIVENSVKVLLNGQALTPGVDYVVDYNVGQLTIRNDAALVPGANLKITFEQNDLFQLASKTLLGMRGVFDFSQKTKLGFSVLNLNQQTLSQKVRIGEEPLNNTIYGIDFSTGADLPFVTNALDKIISTKEMSSISVNGEYAYIKPDPNTIKSTIPSDQGKSIAYIDDFEATKKLISIGVSYTSWKDISPPLNLSQFKNIPADIYPDSIMSYKAKSFWYTVTPSPVIVPDLWGTRKVVAKADEQVTVLDYVYSPNVPGTYAGFGKYVKPTDYSNPANSWGGIMKPLSSTASNLIDENIEYIEFWANADSCPAGSKIYLDLGRISEDVIPNNKLDSEDKNLNGLIDEGEDTGIDGLTDDEERAAYGNNKPDPAGDDFGFTNGATHNVDDYFSINGTEGNAVLTDIGKFPDTEDMNRNGTLDPVNSYYRYEIPLDATSHNKYIQNFPGEGKGWFLYRIPLKDYIDSIGNPSFTTVETIRMYVTGQNQRMHLKLAEFNLVGNQWQKVLPSDTVCEVSVVNVEDNPSYYSPPGITQQRDLSNPNEVVLQNEQAMDLVVSGLAAGQKREVVKYIPGVAPLDVFDYSEMKLFVHGDNNPKYGDLADKTSGVIAQVYYQFGTDSTNYYEYRQPVTSDWGEIDIKFSELTALKQQIPSGKDTTISLAVPGKPGHFYRVRGNPTLTSIKYLLVGIVNPDDPNKPRLRQGMSGEIWVNELRVIGADQSPGWAYNLSSQVKLADLLTVNFNMSERNPFFHQLSDRFGSRSSTKNWGISADLDVIKLLPFNLPESSLRLSYSHTESIGKPLYLPGTDILVSEAAKLSKTQSADEVITNSQTINVSDSYSASNIRIKIPTNFWLIRDTFNNLSFGFNYNNAFSRSPTVEMNKSWQWNASMSYGLNLSPEYNISPGELPGLSTLFSLVPDYKKLKIYYLPQTFGAQFSLRRQRSTNITRALDYIAGSEPQQTISRDFTGQRGFNIGWKMTEGGFLNLSSNYNVVINSTLAYLETDSYNQQRSESQVWKDIFSGSFFGIDNSYQQTIDIRTNPVLPSFLDIGKYFKIQAGYSAGYQWMYNIAQGSAGRSAGNSGKSNLGLTLSWKSLTQGLFADVPETQSDQRMTGQNQISMSHRGRERNFEEEFRNYDLNNNEQQNNPNNFQNPNNNQARTDTVKNSSLTAGENNNPKDTTAGVAKRSPLKTAYLFLKTLTRIIFFDYDQFSFNFTNSNNISKSGLFGTGTGFYNFWGISQNDMNGPSRLFQFGLSGEVGRRALPPPGTSSLTLSDNFSQQNSFDFKTQRPLWEGAKIDLTWKVSWSLNKSTTLTVDSLGHVTPNGSPNVSGTLSRSFLSLPPVLFLSAFKSGIKTVHDKYDPTSTDPMALSNAFKSGFESLPIFSNFSFLKAVAEYVPRPNWRITWDGLEKFSLLKSFAKRVSFEHAYVSDYTEGWQLTPDGTKQIQTQRIGYGFAPLVGFNFTFADLWGGNLISSVKYSTKTNYDLGITSKSIVETYSNEIGITAGFSKSGFELPLFGLSLKNDIEFSFSYTSSKNTSVNYNMDNYVDGGTPQDGTTRTSIEPRIKYTISSKVTLSIFYTRSSVQPDGPSRIPPTTTNEAGLDVHISIQ